MQRGGLPASFGQPKQAPAAWVVCCVFAAVYDTHAKRGDVRKNAKVHTTEVMPVYQATRKIAPPGLRKFQADFLDTGDTTDTE